MSFAYEIFTLPGASLHPDYGWLLLESLPPCVRPRRAHRNHHVKYILDGSVVNKFEDMEIHLKKGQAIFIPPKKEYTVMTENGCKALDLVICPTNINNMAFQEFIRLTGGNVTVTSPVDLNLSFEELKRLISIPSDLNRILIKNKSEYMAISVLAELSNTGKSKFKQKIESIANSEKFNYNLKTLCKLTGYSQTHFERLMVMHFGCSGIEYFNRIRINEICNLLCTTNFSLAEIAEKMGFCDTSHLNTFFKKRINTTPGKYRKEMNILKRPQ